ncbi:recombinase RecT [Streptomyces sp. NBC_01728]|uniref:recombinase RecT n=1 Tax=unclassified Streptomyces TaxID=2593676 RepID=UPI002253172A|nr:MULTISPECIES: recombinase RecT [unclassified Streptomyces]MCX4458485.1 recombinase RecT [Streptomyces sp. NBC_01719]MCX4497842.1 recombinase RecT [Streptomyces sp. NBC_01728]
MATTLKDRIRAARTGGPAAAEQHDQAPDVPAELADVKGHEQVVPPMSETVMAWLKKYENDFAEALPSHIDKGTFFAAVRALLPSLAKCTPASSLQALLTCARFGLIPDGKHAVIKREGTTAVFVPMAQGFVDLMYRSGQVDSVHVGVIREYDEYSYEPTAPAPQDFVHRPDLRNTTEERGEVVLAYAFAWLKGGARSQVIILSRQDAEEIRDEYSTAYQQAKAEKRTDTFWHTHFLQMWMKSCVRRLAKVVPMSAELVALVKVDDAGEAGQVQILHAPDPEDARLLAEAEAASATAEVSQDAPAPTRPLRQRSQPRRKLSRAARKGRRAAA